MQNLHVSFYISINILLFYINIYKNKHCILNLIYIYLGYTSLMYASKYGHLDVVRFLVDSGADVHVKDINGKLV